MKYQLYRTKTKTAKVNNLTAAVSRYYSSNDLFYDFSLLDDLDIDESEKQTIISDTMEHHAVAWYDQPMPTICPVDNFTGYCGQIATQAHRVYKADGRRLMVIIEIIAVRLEKQHRSDIWSEYKTIETYETRTHGHIEEDYEIA